jgi:hypothetical protein
MHKNTTILATFTIQPAGIGQQVVPFLPLPGKPQGITRFAKGLTLVFIVLTCLLLWVGLQGALQQYQLDKILFIMLPGTVYMSYRVFFSPKHTPDT